MGFEGGQMPLQRRLPKVGFASPKVGKTAQVCLHELERVGQETVNLLNLKAANIISQKVKQAKFKNSRACGHGGGSCCHRGRWRNN